MRPAACAALALLLLSYLAPHAAAVGYRVAVEVVMDVPAVAAGDAGLRGVMSRLHVTVLWPGRGDVYFTARPLTELDTQAAARMAVLVASTLAGVDYRGYDYLIRLEADTSIVGGPSASGAIAVAVLAALTGASVRADASMTGMVEPDFSLGPVGGVPQKLEAVAASGKKLFVIPLGQSVAVDPETGARVDVTALGRRLGVKVVEAADVAAAYELLTGSRLGLPRLEDPGLPAWLEELMVAVYENLSSAAAESLSAVKLGELPRAARPLVERLVSEASEALDEASEALRRGLAYVAASRAFYAAVRAEEARLLALWAVNGTGSLVEELRGIAERSGRLLDEVYGEARGMEASALTVEALQILVIVFDRVAEGRRALSLLEASLRLGRLSEAVSAAAYAGLRAVTAYHWLESARAAAERGAPLDPAKLAEAVYAVLDYAETSADYLAALGFDVSPLRELLAEARGRVEEGRLAEALSLAVSALSAAARYMHEAFGAAGPDVGRLRAHAEALAARALEAGVEPLIPRLYLEYGRWFEEAGLVDQAAEMYELAASYALLLYGLVEKEAPPPPGGAPLAPPATVTVTEEHVTTVTVATTVTRTVTTPREVTVTAPDPLSTYAAAASVALALAALGLALARARGPRP